jgi:precorrin-6B methylase 2
MKGNKHTLDVLSAFTKDSTIQQAIDAVWKSGFGAQQFFQISSHILELIRNNFIVPLHADEQPLGIHPSHFDSYPVHLRMLDDDARVLAFQRAIRKFVRSDDVVLEIGVGTGILSATAALAGAKKVIAIEPTRIADVARKVFDANGVGERVDIVPGESTKVDITEKADVLVAEVIGNHALGEGVLAITRDAVSRFLKPDARLIPSRIRLHALPVTIPQDVMESIFITGSMVSRWTRDYGVDLSPLLASVETSDQWFNIEPQKATDWPRLASAILLEEIDLKNITSLKVETSRAFTTDRDGELNGVLLFFSLYLGDGEWLSVAPGEAAEKNHWCANVWVADASIAVAPGNTYQMDYSFSDFSRRSKIRIHAKY